MPDSKFPYQSKKAHHPRLFHLWMPDIFGFTGGIQTYSAFLLKALQDLYPQATIRVFLKNDTRHVLPPQATVNHAGTTFSVMGHWPSRLRTPAFAAQIVAEGLRQRPDLVIASHLHFAPAADWLKRLTRTSYWIVAHGIEAWSIRNPRLITALCNADKLLAVSDFTRNRLAQQLHLSPSELAILTNTFEHARFRVAPKPQYLLERYGLLSQQPIILTVGRLAGEERYKGYDQILHALPQVRRHIPDVHYIIAGQGHDRPRIEQLIAKLELQDSVTLAGFVPDDELCDHYNLCDLYAMPSKGEGFGIVYLEALACGKPVLAGNQDGAVDALCGGELGVLVDPDDVGEIAEAIIKILNRSHTHPFLYHPEKLQEKALHTFGPEQFSRTLAGHLQAQFS